MFADLKDMPTFGSHNASAWAYTEKESFNCSPTSNPPAPDEADVRALLHMLSCRFEDDKSHTNARACHDASMDGASSLHERFELQSRLGGNAAADAHATLVGTQQLRDTESDFLHLFRPHDVDDAPAPLLKPSGAVKDGGYACESNTTYHAHDSSSSNALTGSSSASSNTDRPASTTTSRGAESSGTRLSPSHASRHNTAVSNALANIGSGLAEENFNVLTPDKRMMLSIPADYIQTTLGSRNYRHRNREKLLFSFCLCKTYCSGAACHHGSDCDFIHCDPDKLRLVRNAAESKGKKTDATSVHSFQVHWSTPVHALAEAVYPTLPSGYVVYVKGGEGASGNAPLALQSEMVYATVGGQEALRLPPTAPLRVCKHFEREKCARGALCHFIHPVVLTKTADAPNARSAAPAVAHHRGEADAARHLRSTPPSMQTPPNFNASLAATSHPAGAGAGPLSAPVLTAAQLPSGALVRYGDALYMWVPDRQQLVPLHTTAMSSSAPPVAGRAPAMMVNVDEPRASSGAASAPAGFRMPANAMLVQSSSALAAYPSHNTYPTRPMQRIQTNGNPSSGASPPYPSMIFPC